MTRWYVRADLIVMLTMFTNVDPRNVDPFNLALSMKLACFIK